MSSGGEKEETFRIVYHFSFPDGEEKSFPIELRKRDCALVQEERESYPEWTRLEYEQCSHCPLKAEEHPRCPVAVGVVDLVEFFYNARSIDAVEVTVETEQRLTKMRQTSLFAAISSMMGIQMVGAGCPIMDKLRPMVRHHLPFADAEETIYRALSMYVLAQYFRRKEGKAPDWDLEGLSRTYQDINQLNRDFSRRLQAAAEGEATANAITNLDCFAQMIDVTISEEMLDELGDLFRGYLDDD